MHHFRSHRVLDLRPFILRPFAALLLALLIFNGSRIAHAQSIGILPFERVTTVKKLGATLLDDIEIYNGGSVPLQVSASVVDWSLSPQGKKIYTPVGSSPQSLGAILRLNPTDFTIPPRKSQRVRYSIQVPANMKQELRAMIFFTTRPLPVAGKGVNISVSTKLGCSLFLLPPTKSVLDVAPQLKISDIKIVASPSQIVVSVENNGLSSTRLNGTIEARNTAGAIVATAVLPRTQLLSGGVREIVAQWKSALPAGDYTFKTVLDSGKGKLVSGELRANLTAPIAAAPVETKKSPIAAAPQTSTPKTAALSSTVVK